MKKWKWWTAVFFAALLLSVLGISASADAPKYEPNGTSSTEYKYAASECNRTLVVKCVDESGNLLKEIRYQTKRGEDTSVVVMVYGYDVVGFSSDQGLWETCKITWTSGGYNAYGQASIRYYFRTALSKSEMTAQVVMRRFEDVNVVSRHYKASRYGDNLVFKSYNLSESSSQVLNTGASVSYSAKSYPGFALTEGYAASIGGGFSYAWLDGYKNCSMDWTYVEPALDDSRGEYTSYNASSNGRFSYCKNRTFYIDFYYEVNSYTLYFDANGGTGAPEPLTQYYGYDVKIPNTVPSKSGSTFLGWSADPYATSASYAPGSPFTMSVSPTLYAVWEKYEYNFSASTLIIEEAEIYQNTVVTVRVRTDNWDRRHAYTDIPVELYYDGMLLATQRVDYEAYGSAKLTFRVDVGTQTGNHEIEVRINWSNRGAETDPDNNSVKQTIAVKSDAYAFFVEAVSPNAAYTAGRTVITSYLVYNDAEQDVLPDAGARAVFTAYYYDGGRKVEISRQVRENLAIPKGKSNLVYFKWTLPSGIAGRTVYCACAVNGDGALKENNLANNTAVLSRMAAGERASQTSNPPYDSRPPKETGSGTLPTDTDGSAKWTVWEYRDGAFVLKPYGLKVAADRPTLTPGESCRGAFYENGRWVVKSGYGVAFSFAPRITTWSGYSAPQADAYTGVQSAVAVFPEYGYSETQGKCRTLMFVDGVWCFAENDGADGGERVHFIPVWFSDGEYTVSVVVSEIWTPAGMVRAVRHAMIGIDGSLYDDWYK